MDRVLHVSISLARCSFEIVKQFVFGQAAWRAAFAQSVQSQYKENRKRKLTSQLLDSIVCLTGGRASDRSNASKHANAAGRVLHSFTSAGHGKPTRQAVLKFQLALDMSAHHSQGVSPLL